jgi:DNA-binding transcriptional ArsR family regulator
MPLELIFNYMVECISELDLVFQSLADPTRRDILKRVAQRELSVSEVAAPYVHLTYAAVSKHLKVLEGANLIHKRRQGKERVVILSPLALRDASRYLEHYKKQWRDRFDRLDDYLQANA